MSLRLERIVFTLSFCMLFIVGCGGSSGGDVGPNPGQPAPPPPTPINNDNPAAPLITLSGLEFFGQNENVI